jgi:hypothetical protein
MKLGQLPVIPNGSTVGYQVIEKSREEFIQDLRTAGQQNMDMPTLRDPSSDSGAVRQHIPIDHSDGPKEISQDPRGKQPTHACPKNDRALTQFWHGEAPESKSDVRHRWPNHPQRYQSTYSNFTESADQGTPLATWKPRSSIAATPSSTSWLDEPPPMIKGL